MILTRRAKRLAVPVIVCTILPLAVHFAWRFLTSRWWISAAGLLEALSFLSRDRNFDYFPDDRSTSKKSVFSPVDDKSQLPSTRLLTTLLRDVVFGNAWSRADPRKRLMSGDRGRSREDRKDSQHSRRLLGYTQTRIRVRRRKRKACKMQRAVAIGLDPLRELGSQFDRRGTLSHAYRRWDCSTARNNPALKKQRTRTYIRTWQWTSWLLATDYHDRNRSLDTLDHCRRHCTWRNTTTTGASRGNVRSCVWRSAVRESDTDLDAPSRNGRLTIDNPREKRVPSTGGGVRENTRFYLSLFFN